MVVALASCSNEEDFRTEETLVPIGFAYSLSETESVTRASATLGHDFVVYGYKNVYGTEQTVFDGYTVKYLEGSANTSEDNTHGYYYVHGNQTIKYWDFGASEYNFWGATGGNFNSDGTTLTILGLTLTTTEPADLPLFSVLYHRSPVSTDVVQLRFKRPYARVRVLFYTNAALTDKSFDNIKISGITFGPESPKKIITQGNLKVTYPESGEGPETYSTTSTAEASCLTFNDVTLDHTHGTASNNAIVAVPKEGSLFYYVVPNDNAASFKLSAQIDSEVKTAVVPAEFMDWHPNYVYTYIFKISGGRYMELYDVQIDPWKYGGSQDEEWRNW